MDDTTEKYYRFRAPEYEQIYYRDDVGRRNELDEEAERLRQLARDKDVLEIACGTGYWTKVMSESAGSILATDLSGEMIREAQKKTYACPVRFQQSDMMRLGFGDQTFGLIALGFWFSHHPRQDYGQLFDLIEAQLASNGVVWMIDNNPPAEGPQTNHAYLDGYGNHFKYRWLDDGTRFTILKNYFSESELGKIFSPRFKIKSIIYNRYYWSVQLTIS